MSFKDHAAADLATFFNLGEFAETVNIDNANIAIVIDNETLAKRSEKSGLYIGEILYYARSSEFAKLPKPGAVQVFDQRRYTVQSANELDGTIEVILRKYEGR